MILRTATYTTLTAAAALACGAAYGIEAGQGVGESADPATEQVLDARGPAGDQVPIADEHAAERGAAAHEQLEESQDLAAKRDELTRMAAQAIARLRQEDRGAGQHLDAAYGYAVFDTTKGGLIVTGAGGTGVARRQATGEETFMHVASAGIGVGAGAENYKLVLLFADQQTYDDFVTGHWDGSIAAQAAAGEQGAAAEAPFVRGTKVYRLTDAGLIAQLDISGMKFWPSERLNSQ